MVSRYFVFGNIVHYQFDAIVPLCRLLDVGLCVVECVEWMGSPLFYTFYSVGNMIPVLVSLLFPIYTVISMFH